MSMFMSIGHTAKLEVAARVTSSLAAYQIASKCSSS